MAKEGKRQEGDPFVFPLLPPFPTSLTQPPKPSPVSFKNLVTLGEDMVSQRGKDPAHWESYMSGIECWVSAYVVYRVMCTEASPQRTIGMIAFHSAMAQEWTVNTLIPCLIWGMA